MNTTPAVYSEVVAPDQFPEVRNQEVVGWYNGPLCYQLGCVASGTM